MNIDRKKYVTKYIHVLDVCWCSALNFNYHFLGYSSLKGVDLILLGRKKTRKRYTNFQQIELLKSFLNNNNLTKLEKVKLSKELAITQRSVTGFFHKQNKKPRNESIMVYAKLLQSE